MDVSGGSSANGSQIQIYTSNGTAAQKWKITTLSDGYYTLSPGNATTSALDLDNAGTANGTKVQIYSANGTIAQKFRFILQ
ncbi:Glucan endo-1,3-beta-glucosidase precursor [compost metagenome]